MKIHPNKLFFFVPGEEFTLENHDYATRSKSRRGETWRTGKINGVSFDIL